MHQEDKIKTKKEKRQRTIERKKQRQAKRDQR